MAIGPGTRIGAYEVVGPLGEGGMGVVLRGRDTRLQRDVALKLLPDHLANDPDRLFRFQREAQILASLNHPHIAQVFGLEQADGSTCIVMELVEGDTLADRLKSGPMSFDEVRAVAAQLAEALAAAHERGIVHRDLKPANIKLSSSGVVKVLDFGLAKAVGPEHHRHAGHLDANGPDAIDAGDDPGHAGLHVARAGARQGRGRPDRHLGVRLRGLRDADGAAGVCRRNRHRRHRAGGDRAAGPEPASGEHAARRCARS